MGDWAISGAFDLVVGGVFNIAIDSDIKMELSCCSIFCGHGSRDFGQALREGFRRPSDHSCFGIDFHSVRGVQKFELQIGKTGARFDFVLVLLI